MKNSARCALLLPALLVLLLCSCSHYFPRSGPGSRWFLTEMSWNGYALPAAEVIKQRQQDPMLKWIELRSYWITKFLPEYRLYVMPTISDLGPRVVALHQEGYKVVLDPGKTMIAPATPGPDWMVMGIPDLMTQRELKIQNGQKAVNLVQCVRDLMDAPYIVGVAEQDYLHHSLQPVVDLDRWWGFPKPTIWDMAADQTDDGWRVFEVFMDYPVRQYRPARTWLVQVDGQKNLVGIILPN